MIMDDVQFRIRIHLPKTLQIMFDEVSQQINNALKVYQQRINPAMTWYPIKSSTKANLEELIYSPDGFTEFGLKKLTRACKRMEKQSDMQFDIADGEKSSVGQVMIYSASKYISESYQGNSYIFFSLYKPKNTQTLNQITSFVTGLAEVFSNSYITIDLMSTFPKSGSLFPKRVGTSLIVYIPSPLLGSDYPEAHQIIPISKEGKQVGTVIVSLDHFPSPENKEDIKTINRLDLKLCEADLLPITSDL